ncbi:NACHT domain-containing protein [Arthrobacter sp. efr-133-TYG-118]|uniref:NACHT domain-containing protein n=1 Tax=Arthrobacter sp. efr-133-TYG-118 TaxID=3040279 RepID=UPI00254A611B|nr:NACHT domain-containing protein [Arthrobacter sp. efr-133-TYG-118]
MLDLVPLASRAVPRVVSSLRTAFSQNELANALTGEQGWTRRILKQHDGFEFIASHTANALRTDRSVQTELGGTTAQWNAIAGDVAKLLADAFSAHDALLDLVRDPEHGMQRILDVDGRRAIEALHAEEPATTRLSTAIWCSLSVVVEVVRYADWFNTDATVDQMRSQLRIELLAKETRSLIDEIHAASVEQSNAAWPTTAVIEALDRPPEYYPDGFSNRDLAKDLLVTRVDDLLRFVPSDREDLYWDGRLYGESERLDGVLPSSSLTVILGNPGSGKSTLAKDLVVQAVKAGEKAAFARLADVAAILTPERPITKEREALAAIAQAMTRAVSARVSPDALLEAARASREAENTCQTLVVLDGLDEIPSAAGQAAVKQLVNLLIDCRYRLVITSRITGYSTPFATATHVAVLPITEAAAASTADRWFDLSGSMVARKRYNRTIREASLSELNTNPLMLGFMCFVAHHEEVPGDQASLFDRFVDHFLRRKWHPRTHWIDDDAQVARVHRAATTVAWAMAKHKHNSIQSLWRDSEVLATLEDWTSSPDAPYEVYLSGILVPHGLQESPFSRRFQRVRWMHRAIHEYFTATVLARRIQTRSEGWWEDFLDAALHPSWIETIHQSCQLLGDGPALHGLVDALRGAIEDGDTPDFSLTYSLALVSDYCKCAHRRRTLAKFLAHGRFWRWAFDLDPQVATDLAVDIANRGGIVKQISLALQRRSTGCPASTDQVESMLEAGVLSMHVPDQAAVVWEARLWADIGKWWPRALEFAAATGDMSFAHNLPELEPQTLAQLAEQLVQAFADGSIGISGTEVAFLDQRILKSVADRADLHPRIDLGLEIKEHLDKEKSDFSTLAVKMSGIQHPRDVLGWGPLLMVHSDWEPENKQQRELTFIGREALLFSNACGSLDREVWKLDPGDDLTVDDLPFAEEIINGLKDDREHSAVEIGGFFWALRVLAAFPSSRVYDQLLDWDRLGHGPRMKQAELGFSASPLDSSDFVSILNAQDWRALAREALQDISDASRLSRAGGILCAAASIWVAPANLRIRPADYHAVSPNRAAELWLDGLQAQLLGEDATNARPDMLTFLPEGLPEDILIQLAIDVVQLTSGFSGPVARDARVGAERALAAAGALAYFYEEIAVPHDMLDGD